MEHRARWVRVFLTTAFSGVLFSGILLTGCVSPGPPPGGEPESAPSDQVGSETTESIQDLDDSERSTDPLFAVNSVIVQLQWGSPSTVILLPAQSFITDFLRGEPGTVIGARDPEIRAGRIRVLFNLNTTAAPPFVPDRDRYLYPELYD